VDITEDLQGRKGVDGVYLDILILKWGAGENERSVGVEKGSPVMKGKDMTLTELARGTKGRPGEWYSL